MPIKSHGEKPDKPQNKREHKSVQKDETVMKALEGTGKLDTAMEGGRK